jgi:hypothetical protein
LNDDRNVPDFRVAHQTVAEANSGAVGSNFAERVLLADSVHVSRRARRNRVTILGLGVGETPSIVYTAQIRQERKDRGKQKTRQSMAWSERTTARVVYMRQTLFFTSAGIVAAVNVVMMERRDKAGNSSKFA